MKRQHIVIVGGGSAGWMSGAYLNRHLKNTHFDITLISSEKIPTVGVGEATLPGIKDFYRTLGLTDQYVIDKTKATFKLGISFEGWSKKNDKPFFHPFGLYGQQQSNLPFHHCWLKTQKDNAQCQLEAFSLATQLARKGKFIPTLDQHYGDWSVFDYALHFDAGLYAKLLQNCAIDRGVSFIQAKLTKVIQKDNGEISQLILDNGDTISADFFIDCTGFKGQLIRQTLNAEFDDWTHWLNCNTAVVMSSQALESIPNYTRSITMPAGWRWQIPLQHRTGNGYVFNRDFQSVDEATQSLINSLPSPDISEPRSLSFTTGRVKMPWTKNCLAIGLASGFLEPLESTSISMIETALERFLQLLPHQLDQVENYQTISAEYNRQAEMEANNIRDFIILHYAASQRNDTRFWQQQKQINLPDSLAYKMQLYKKSAQIIQYDWESFSTQSWLSLYVGLGVIPNEYSPLADRISAEQLSIRFEQIKQNINTLVQKAPSTNDYLQNLLRIKN